MAQDMGSMVGIRIAGIAGTAGIHHHRNASRTAGASCVRIAGIHRNASSRIAGIALLLASLLSSLPAAHAQCYLLNANSNCSVCWKTVYGDLADKIGVTTSAECPDAIAVKWTEAPPKEMLALETYPLKYSLSVNPQKFEVVKQGANQVPHANIHSCIASKGACTPFVANSPGLATHTEALVGGLDPNGFALFKSETTLTAETYTIIAHVRFFVKDAKKPNAPAIKYDVAIGSSREVHKHEESISTDSIVMTAVIAFILFLGIGSCMLGIRSGRIDMDRIIETLYSDAVTVTFDIVLGFGDTAAYTVGVVAGVVGNYKLIQILPAALFFMVVAWTGTIYNAYYDVRQLMDVHFQHRNLKRYTEQTARRFADKAVTEAVKKKKRASIAGVEVDGALVAQSAAQGSIQKLVQARMLEMAQRQEERFLASLDYEIAEREVRRKRGDVIIIFCEALPITIISMYIMLNGGKIQAMTIVILLFTSIVCGAKIAGLGGYKEIRIHRDKMLARVNQAFEIYDIVDASADNKVAPVTQEGSLEQGERASLQHEGRDTAPAVGASARKTGRWFVDEREP